MNTNCFNTMIRSPRWMAGIVPVMAAASLAAACPPESAEGEYQFDHTRAPVAMSFFGNDEDRSIKIEIKNDDIKAWVNGEEVPADRIRREDGRVVILDENGKELEGVFMHGGGDHGHWATAFGDVAFPEGALEWERAVAAAEAGPPPTVMLGIMMDEPGAALLKHLDLEEGTTTMISGVHEGLPADEAGLGEFDIIVKVDGDSPADPGSIKEVLSGKQAGDIVKFTVISKGKTRDVKVKLAAYDAEKMESATVLGTGLARYMPAMIELERAMEAGGANGRDFAEKLRRELLVAPEARIFRVQPGPGGPSGLQDVIIERQQMNEAFEERLAELDERLARLEEMLEQLAAENANR